MMYDMIGTVLRRTRISFLQYISLLLMLLWCCLPQANAEQHAKSEKVLLQLKWRHQFQFAGYYAALEKGYYREAGLDVSLIEGAPKTDTVEEVVAGRAQYGVGMPELLLARVQGKPVVVLAAIFQHSPQVLLTLADSGINSPHDLAGRKVMLNMQNSGEIKAMLLHEGISLGDINMVDHTWMLDGLIKRQIDAIKAYISVEPFILDSKGISYTIIEPITYGIDFYGDCLFTSEEEIKQHPNRVQAFRKASLKGWEYAMMHPEEIIDLIITKYDSPLSREFLRHEASAMRDLILPNFIEIVHMNHGRWEHIAETFAEVDMIKPGYSLEGFLYDPNHKPDYTMQLLVLRIIAFIALLVVLLVIALVIFNRQLNKKVLTQTKALRDSENRYRVLLQTIPYGIQETDTEGKITYSNPAHAKIHGYHLDEMIGKKITDLLPDAAQAKKLADYLRYLVEKQPEPTTYIETNKTKDGRIIDVSVDWNYLRDEGGRVTGFIAAITDITASKKLEDSLKASEKKYRDLFENANDAIFIVDPAFHYIDVNKKAVDLFGYSREEFLSMKITDVIPPEQMERSSQEFRKLSEKGKYEKFIGKMKAKDGRWRDIEVSSSAIYENGKIIGSRDIVRDITERLQMEEQLRHAQKMEAIGTLAGGIAHDFNNILAAIMGYADLACLDLPDGSSAKKSIREVVRAANRAKELVRHILIFSRKTDQEKAPMHIQQIVREALKLLRASIPSTVLIQQHIDTDCGAIMANPTQIHQIVMNLCTNAAQAMEIKGGIIEVCLTCTKLDRYALPPGSSMQPGAYIKLSILDNGPGIPPEIRDRMFEPYFTTKGVGKGSGLGLAVVHGIVKAHNGEIVVESAIGRGSAFHIYFPMVHGEEQALVMENDALPVGNERILLVDDEQAIADLGKRILERLGYSVSAWTDSRLALKAFEEAPTHFDLVVTDQTMPGMTGCDLAREILRLKPEMPIILCTGYSSIVDEDKAKSIGINEFIMKPFDQRHLTRTVRSVLDVPRENRVGSHATSIS